MRAAHGRDAGTVRGAVSDCVSQPRPGHGRATRHDRGHGAALGIGVRERVPYGQRRANAAVTLLRLGEREKALPVFEVTDDPEALTQFIFRCRPRGWVWTRSWIACGS